MISDDNRRSVERLLAGINAGNGAVFEELYLPDAVIEWPQYGQRIIGGADRRKAFDATAVLPNVHPRRIVGELDVWVVEALYEYEDEERHVVKVIEFNQGKVARETSYWAEPKDGSADWKSPWVQKLEPLERVPEPEELEES